MNYCVKLFAALLCLGLTQLLVVSPAAFSEAPEPVEWYGKKPTEKLGTPPRSLTQNKYLTQNWYQGLEFEKYGMACDYSDVELASIRYGENYDPQLYVYFSLSCVRIRKSPGAQIGNISDYFVVFPANRHTDDVSDKTTYHCEAAGHKDWTKYVSHPLTLTADGWRRDSSAAKSETFKRPKTERGCFPEDRQKFAEYLVQNYHKDAQKSLPRPATGTPSEPNQPARPSARGNIHELTDIEVLFFAIENPNVEMYYYGRDVIDKSRDSCTKIESYEVNSNGSISFPFAKSATITLGRDGSVTERFTPRRISGSNLPGKCYAPRVWNYEVSDTIDKDGLPAVWALEAAESFCPLWYCDAWTENCRTSAPKGTEVGAFTLHRTVAEELAGKACDTRIDNTPSSSAAIGTTSTPTCRVIDDPLCTPTGGCQIRQRTVCD